MVAIRHCVVSVGVAVSVPFRDPLSIRENSRKAFDKIVMDYQPVNHIRRYILIARFRSGCMSDTNAAIADIIEDRVLDGIPGRCWPRRAGGSDENSRA